MRSQVRWCRPWLEELEQRQLLSFALTHGVYALSQVNIAVPAPILANPSVDGIAVRSTWDSIEIADNVYNWSFLDSQVAAAAGAGRKVSLSIAAGVRTPAWVYAQGAAPFLSSAGDTVPIPWDRTFLDRWEEFIRDLGARYAAVPAVDRVKVTGINYRTEEIFLPITTADVAQWASVGYTRLRVLDAYAEITDTFAAAFPLKGVTPMLIPGGFPPLDDQGNPIPGVAQDFQIRDRLVQYGIDHHPEQFIAQNNGLSTFFIPPWIVAVADQITTGYQMLSVVTGDTTYRMNNGVPDSPVTILQAAVNRGIDGGARFLEIYPPDILNPALQGVLADAHARLTSPLMLDSIVIKDGPAPYSVVTGFTVQLSQAIDPGVLNLYDSATAGLGPADVQLAGADTGPVRGSLVVSPDNRSITFLATGGPLPPDTYTITLRSAADGFRTPDGALLDGDNDGTSDGDYTATFVGGPSSAVAVSIPDFSRGPGQAVHVPASATGLPLRLSNGSGVQSISLTLRFDPALLNITGASAGTGTPGDATAMLVPLESGLVRVEFSSPSTPLGAGPIDFVQLMAQVKTDAPYGSKAVLDLGDISINAGAIPSRDNDGLHVIVYLGDVTGNAAYSSADATRILRVAVGLDSGFQALRLVDPVIIADSNNNGRIDSTDATRILQEAIGIDRPEIPALPGVIPPIVPGGPDPYLNLPKRLRGRPGDLVRVPVLLDLSDGLDAVDLALSYNTSRLEVVSPDAIRRGTLTHDFDVFAVNLDATAGLVRVGLGRSAGAISGRGSGSVLEITFRIKANAPAGSAALNLRQAIGETRTQLNEGGLELNPAPSDEAGDALDGQVFVETSSRRHSRRGGRESRVADAGARLAEWVDAVLATQDSWDNRMNALHSRR